MVLRAPATTRLRHARVLRARAITRSLRLRAWGLARAPAAFRGRRLRVQVPLASRVRALRARVVRAVRVHRAVQAAQVASSAQVVLAQVAHAQDSVVHVRVAQVAHRVPRSVLRVRAAGAAAVAVAPVVVPLVRSVVVAASRRLASRSGRSGKNLKCGRLRRLAA